MAKKRARAGAVPKNTQPTKEEAAAMVSKAIPTEKKTPKKREKQGVLYVSTAHHLKAKKDALNKGFSKLKDYIEHLIDTAK